MIPRLDDDGSIEEGIAALRPTMVVDETPHGRLAGINQDTWRVYTEMYDLLTGHVTASSTAAYEEHLRDLTTTLSDLHKRGEQDLTAGCVSHRPVTDPAGDYHDRTVSREVMNARYPPDGDTNRWVKEGPEGHINYTLGQR